MATVKIKIDGQAIEVEEGSYVLDAAQSLGIEIPTLCYYPYMSPYAACRICVVEARNGKGWSKIVTACNYPAWDGLEIFTDTPRVVNARRTNLEMLMANCAPVPVLERLAAKFGVKEPRWGHWNLHLYPVRSLRPHLRRSRRCACPGLCQSRPRA